MDLNKRYAYKLKINNKKANVQRSIESWRDGDSVVVPHVLDLETTNAMFAAAKKLYSKPHGKVGGGVPEVKVLDRPSSLGTLPPDNKAFIDKFIMPFMDKMGVPQNELLQVTLTISSNLGDNIVQ